MMLLRIMRTMYLLCNLNFNYRGLQDTILKEKLEYVI
jgi:hypothetical protein